MQEQLPIASQTWVHFTVFVKVRDVGPGAVAVMEVEDHAFADVDEEASWRSASIGENRIFVRDIIKRDLGHAR